MKLFDQQRTGVDKGSMITPARQRIFRADLRPPRGIPAPVLNAILDSLGCDDRKVHKWARLEQDLGCDDMDRAELADNLEAAYGVQIDDRALDWVTVADVLKTLKQAGVAL